MSDTVDLTVPFGIFITFTSTFLAGLLCAFTTYVFIHLGSQSYGIAFIAASWCASSFVRCIFLLFVYDPAYMIPFINARTPEQMIAANIPVMFDVTMWAWTVAQVLANTSVTIVVAQLYCIIVLPRFAHLTTKIFYYGAIGSAFITVLNPLVTVAVRMSPRYTPSIIHSFCVWVNLCFSAIAVILMISTMIYRRYLTRSVLGSSSLSKSLIIRLFIASVALVIIAATSTYTTYQHGRFEPVLINLYDQLQQPYSYLAGSFGGTAIFICFCTSKEAVRFIRRLLGLKELVEKKKGGTNSNSTNVATIIESKVDS